MNRPVTIKVYYGDSKIQALFEDAPKQVSLFSSTLYLFSFMVQRHYTGVQSISQINYDLRLSVPVSADQDHSSTEVNNIENWAVKNRMKLNPK